MSDVFVFSSVSKTFRSRSGESTVALDGFTAAGRAGEITCLLGQTGCGKTTALRLMAGLETADAGTVLLDGEPPAPGRTGYVTQEHTLLPWLRLADNTALPLRLAGVPRAARRRRANELHAQVGLDGKAHLYPHECSGGMRQRAMLARLLAQGASRWLMDEPFSATDERTREGLQRLLLALRAERQLAILFVTHSIEEAICLADRIVLMAPSPGRAMGEIEVSIPHPRDPVSPGFVSLLNEVRRRFRGLAGDGRQSGGDQAAPENRASCHERR